eukprot:TRINITY_DN996_c0_g2_i1.p1 TRINITY_DN996_c0_g2~~TRINITY_DN996_c0_g2_i1.p1  ORF type:complete len:327 (+),score=130.78 TRINITY_DN996_c0_g2_i1:179-1159(+)
MAQHQLLRVSTDSNDASLAKKRDNYGSEETLLEPYNYLLQIPGKEIRGRLIVAFDYWFGVPKETLVQIEKIVKMLHTSSLIIDDIEDNSKLRRGIPVAHSIYGVAWSINAANYVYFQALQDCNKLGNAEATQAFLDEIISLHKGQGFDIYWRDRNYCPSEESYREMVLDKTGGLFRLAIKVMQSFSKNKTNYIELVNLLALYFQIRDDYVNLQSDQYMVNKGFCEDFSEGKFSFPIIHSILSNPSDHRLLNVLKQRTEDVEIKKYAVEYMKKTGSFSYTLNILKDIEKQINLSIEKFGGNKELEGMMQDLSISKYQNELNESNEKL